MFSLYQQENNFMDKSDIKSHINIQEEDLNNNSILKNGDNM